jgi:hypothetical protein
MSIGNKDIAVRANNFRTDKVPLPFEFSISPAKETINNKLVNAVEILKLSI